MKFKEWFLAETVRIKMPQKGPASTYEDWKQYMREKTLVNPNDSEWGYRAISAIRHSPTFNPRGLGYTNYDEDRFRRFKGGSVESAVIALGNNGDPIAVREDWNAMCRETYEAVKQFIQQVIETSPSKHLAPLMHTANDQWIKTHLCPIQEPPGSEGNWGRTLRSRQ